MAHLTETQQRNVDALNKDIHAQYEAHGHKPLDETLTNLVNAIATAITIGPRPNLRDQR